MDTIWFPAAYRDSLPEHAVVAGESRDGTIVVGRAFVENEMLPAMVIPDISCAFVSRSGKVYEKSKYDVLVGHGYSWKLCSDCKIPANAVKVDNQKSDEEIFIGRVLCKNDMCVGRVDAAQGCLFFPYKGEEKHIYSYDILILDQSENWISTSFYYTPADAVEGGLDTDGALIYVGRALHDGLWLPAKVIPSKTCAYISHEGMEIFVRDYQILRGHGYLWHKVYGHFIPSNAVATGATENGEPMYVGRGNFNGSLTPGLISLSRKCCILPYGGRAISVMDYEVLIK